MTWLDLGGERSRSEQAVEVAKASVSTLGHQSSSFVCSSYNDYCHKLEVVDFGTHLQLL